MERTGDKKKYDDSIMRYSIEKLFGFDFNLCENARRGIKENLYQLLAEFHKISYLCV